MNRMNKAWNDDEAVDAEIVAELAAIRAQALSAHPVPERAEPPVAENAGGAGFWRTVGKGALSTLLAVAFAEESEEDRRRDEYSAALSSAPGSSNPGSNRYWYLADDDA